VVKKTDLTAFRNPRAAGIIAMGVDDDDAVMAVQLSDGGGEIFIGTRDGMAIRFPEGDVRPTGRGAYGVRGIALRENDAVVAIIVTPGGTLLTVSKRLRQRTDLDEYRVQSRGGLGIINIHTTDRNGPVVGIAYVRDEDELMLITEQGKILRMVTRDVRTIGRATQGVRLIGVDEDDRVVSIARLAERVEDLNE
jgi:DNA gyrase subunit A